MESVKVQFSEDELAYIIRSGSARTKNKRNQGIPPAEYGEGFTPIDRDINSFAGEYAVARLLKLEANSSITQLGDGGYDINAYGFKVECKTIQLPTHKYLILQSDEGQEPDIYVVVRGYIYKQGKLTGNNKVEIVGWCERKEIWNSKRFFKKGTHPATRYGDRYIMLVTELRPFQDFRNMLDVNLPMVQGRLTL